LIKSNLYFQGWGQQGWGNQNWANWNQQYYQQYQQGWGQMQPSAVAGANQTGAADGNQVAGYNYGQVAGAGAAQGAQVRTNSHLFLMQDVLFLRKLL